MTFLAKVCSSPTIILGFITTKSTFVTISLYNISFYIKNSVP